MRLYKLGARVGKYRGSLLPWFDDPLAERPEDWAGWHWDMKLMKWVEIDLPTVTSHITRDRLPMPDVEPRPKQDVIVDGWSWNGRTNKWEEVPMQEQLKVVTPDRPPAPDTGPGRGEAWTVPGWQWGPWDNEWQPVPMEKIEVPYTPERGPAPEYPPGPFVSDTAPDWFWDYGIGQWSPATIYAEAVTYTPPGSLPPYAVDEAGLVPGPYEHEWRAFLEGMLSRGYTVSEARRVADSMRQYYWTLSKPVKVETFTQMWDGFVEQAAGLIGDQIQKIGSTAAIIGLVALVGFLIGMVAERIVEPEEVGARIYPEFPTYLLGPGDWLYASLAGVSPLGVPWFRSCDPIGAVNAQHLRGEPWQIDRIAFTPGGFLETGWQSGVFVKYLWLYWEITYVGFLIRHGADLYSLQEGYYLPGHPPAGYVVKPEYVCPEFRSYL